jgi:hypothetical protein
MWRNSLNLRPTKVSGTAFHFCIVVATLLGVCRVQAFSSRVGLFSGVRPSKKPLVKPLSSVGDQGSTNDENEGNPIPSYKETDLAREVFASKYFYRGDQNRADTSSGSRDLFFDKFGIVTVRDMTDKLKSSEVRKLLDVLFADWEEVISFCKGPKTIEQELHDAEIVALNCAQEIEAIQSQYVAMENLQEVVKRALDRTEGTEKVNRVMDYVVVLGSSGSGKTFFAVKEAAGYGAAQEHASGLHATLYLHPERINGFNVTNVKAIPTLLADWIRKELEKGYGKFGQLNMHISIVLDEIGMLGYFESIQNIDDLFKELSELAASVRLVISGTGLSAAQFSTNRVPKCRLRRWDEENVKQLLTGKQFNFTVPQSEEVVKALRSQFMLVSLLTNARTCYFLLSSIKDVIGALKLDGKRSKLWLSLINTVSPGLIASVVDRYNKRNGIGALTPEQCRRVAACAFRVLDEALPALLVQPDLTGLSQDEKTVALGLLEQNLEKTQQGLKFGTPDKRSVTVSSALVVVLYYMLGIRAEFFPDWHNQEQVTARYAYRKQLLDFMTNLLIKYKECTQQYQRSALDTELDEYLSDLRFVALRNKVERPSGKVLDSFLLPRLPSNTVMLNAAYAAFGDVFTKGVIYQSKYCETDKNEVEVAFKTELGKCGLLRSQTINDLRRVVVLALSLIWDGIVDGPRDQGKISVAQDASGLVRQLWKEQESDAYPDNLLKTPFIEDTLAYVSVNKTDEGWVMCDDEKRITVPTQLPKLSYVLSTNADRIVLTGVFRKQLKITNADVHVDGRCLTEDGRQGMTVEKWNEEKKGTINEDALEDRKELWASYKAMAAESVTLKFLFTT